MEEAAGINDFDKQEEAIRKVMLSFETVEGHLGTDLRLVEALA